MEQESYALHQKQMKLTDDSLRRAMYRSALYVWQISDQQKKEQPWKK